MTGQPSRPAPRSVPIDLRRRPDARLQVSRIAADLFWTEGVDATRGEDVARVAGISTRTLWRYFRSKEACVEPVLRVAGRRLALAARAWPRSQSIEEYLAPYGGPEEASYAEDDLRAMRMVAVGRDEPALRGVWLLVCDEAEAELAEVVAERLGPGTDPVRARVLAAAVSAAVRAGDDERSTAVVREGRRYSRQDVIDPVCRAVRDAGGGVLGDAVDRSAGERRGGSGPVDEVGKGGRTPLPRVI